MAGKFCLQKCLLAFNSRNVSNTAAISFQQIRFASKSFKLRRGDYGVEPLITHADFEKAKEANLLEELSYKEVKFPLHTQTCSPLYDEEFERFCKYIMKGGRKHLAHDLMHETFFHIKSTQFKKLQKLSASEDSDPERVKEENIELNPLVILKTALANSEPLVVTKKVKRGGATYQVPYPLTKNQSEYFALKWMIKSVQERPKPRKKSFPVVMAQELLDAFYGRGKVIKRRDDIHRLAQANKAYAHYRWG